MKKILALSCVVLVFSLMAAAAGKKAPGPSTQGVQVAQTTAPLATKNHTVKQTYVNSGVPFVTLPAATFFALDTPVSASCTRSAGCTLLVDAFATSGVDASGGNRALCVALNGALVGACPYSGRSATDGSFSQFKTDEIELHIPFGTTTAQVLAFSDTGATVYMYRIVYRVYAP